MLRLKYNLDLMLAVHFYMLVSRYASITPSNGLE